jgi:hypothetical protein
MKTFNIHACKNPHLHTSAALHDYSAHIFSRHGSLAFVIFTMSALS